MKHCWSHRVGLHLRNVALVMVKHNPRGEILLCEHGDLQPYEVVRFGDVPGQRGLVAVRHGDLTNGLDHLLHEKQRSLVVLLEVKTRVYIPWCKTRGPE